jgi:hypothetical protein
MTSAGPNRLMRAALAAGPACAYLAACRVMLAPICNFAALRTATYEGDARLVAWALAWDNRAVAAGARSLRSLFDANIFYPARGALAYGEHFFGISLFTLPVYFATHNAALGYNAAWLASYFLAACAAHVVTWRLTRDHLASFVAGLAFAFCFFRMHHGPGHLHLLWAFWIPLSLVAMDRWLATLSWPRLAVLTAILILQALSSWYQAVLIFVADALLMLWLIFVDRAWPWTPARASRLAQQTLAGAAVALAIVWPFAHHYTVLAPAGPAEVAPLSADLAAYLVPPENTLLGRWLLRNGVKGPRWIWGELTLYLGWITMTLAAAGALVALGGGTPERRRLRFFVTLGGVALLLAIGPNAREIADNAWHWSAFGALAHIPGAALFRAPARFALLLTLALAVLAGGACAAAHERWGRAGRIATLTLVPLMLLEFYVVDFPGGPPPPFPVPAIYRHVATLPAGVVVSLPDYAATPLWFREPDYEFFSTAHWHPIVNGYSRAEPAGFRERIERLATFPDPAAMAAIRETGIRYVVVHAGQYSGGADAAARASAATGIRLLARYDADYLFEIAR